MEDWADKIKHSGDFGTDGKNLKQSRVVKSFSKTPRILLDFVKHDNLTLSKVYFHSFGAFKK